MIGNILTELAEAKIKEKLYSEMPEKLSPSELLNKSKILGISGDDLEIENIKKEVEENEKKHIKTKNEHLEGQKHPETGVEFEKYKFPDGKEGVFPKFDQVFETKLPDDLCEQTDKAQEKYCNEKLKVGLENQDLNKKFTTEQIEQIKNGRTPEGYTWHHHQEKGKMQLVDSEIHAKTGHTGGRVIWGGGTEKRKG